MLGLKGKKVFHAFCQASDPQSPLPMVGVEVFRAACGGHVSAPPCPWRAWKCCVECSTLPVEGVEVFMLPVEGVEVFNASRGGRGNVPVPHCH